MEVEWGTIFSCPAARWKNWPSLHAHEKTGTARRGTPLSPGQIEKRIRYVNENYEVLDWDLVKGKAQVTCKNKDAHTTDTGDGQTIIFIGSDDMGAVSYHCSHAHCGDFNKEETTRLCEGFLTGETFVLPNNNVDFCAMLSVFYGALADKGSFFRASEKYPYAISRWVRGDIQTLPVLKDTLTAALGAEGIKFSKFNARGALVNAIASRETASAILAAPQASVLPIAESVSAAPMLAKTKGGAEIIGESYCPELKTIVLGKASSLPSYSYSEACALLNSLLDYWIWKEPVDRARAVAELLTPALLIGGFVPRPIPAFLMMGDLYGAGKTGWQEDVCQIYGHGVETYVLTKQNIGSIEEKLQETLLRGEPFFFVDELDGKIKSTTINAFITGGDELSVRIAFEPAARVSCTKTIILLAGVTSFVVDPQLASRTVIARIIKPASNANWYTPEGIYLKTWVREHGVEYLSAIYQIIKEWVGRGSRPDPVIRSRFPEWEKTVNGILSMMSLPPATAGLEDLQEEVANPDQGWLPEFAKTLEDNDLLYFANDQRPGKRLSLSALRQICDHSGLEIPGVNPHLRDGVLAAIKARTLGKIISALPRVETTNSQEPLYRLGEFYLAQYSEHDTRRNKRNKSYVCCTSTQLPTQTEQYTIDVEIG